MHLTICGIPVIITRVESKQNLKYTKTLITLQKTRSMKLVLQNITLSLNKAYLAQSLALKDADRFLKNYNRFFDSVNHNESEETLKDYINRFLNDTYYKGKYAVKENENNIDLVIKNGNKADDKTGVIIETKALKNTSEMITPDEINRKALHEAMLYFMQERHQNNNAELKHIIITNSLDWFIFDATEFERVFFKNNSFLNDYKKWAEGKLVSKNNDWFYAELAQPFVEQSDETIKCTYFQLSENTELSESELIGLYKIFSPEHLLKLPFQNDSNTLNTDFYNELLHILGLHEVTRKYVQKIERLPKAKRLNASLLENTIQILETNDFLFQIDEPKRFGETRDEQLFSIGLELVIIWLNRILFLKLLESQLVKFNKEDKDFDYRFLNINTIHDFDELNELFFEVLAIEPHLRTKPLQEKYPHIPYLNSSLYEANEVERETIRINQLKSRKELPVFGATVLKDRNGKRISGSMPLLQYIFDFLDSYNFASDHKAEIQPTPKTIINSAVLGLIFEKINGYQEGSHFTPGFITMYMSREILRKAVINKFRPVLELSENSEISESWTELYNKIGQISIAEANNVINSLKICDPSVGSGHFLVSVLNELIAIKSDLQILADENGRILRDVNVDVENDELFVSIDGEAFTYNFKNPESRRIQKTIFHEKQTLIENCLFGVDINPKSANISRLRLWIELLKNTYYRDDGGLQTLPNIDINIKTGNSLISHFALNGNGNGNGKKKSLKTYTKKYKQVVADYKNTSDREAKHALERFINEQKENFSRTVNPNDEDLREIRKKESEIGTMPMFFSRDDQIQWQKKVERLQNELTGLQEKYDEKLKTVYRNAFEWRFEFPEVLDDNGKFTGFDIVIGNPPYIKEMNAKKIFLPIRKSGIWKKQLEGKMDLWYFFLHKAFEITKTNGLISYITNSYWVKSSGAKKLINRIYESKSLREVVNLNDIPIFEKVVGKHMIHSYEKDKINKTVKYRNVEKSDDFEDIKNIPYRFLNFDDVVKKTHLNIYSEKEIELTIDFEPLGKLFYVSQGVVEAPDKIDKKQGVFVVNEEEYNKLNLTAAEKKVFKKYLNMADVRRFRTNWNKQYLIFSDKTTRSKIAKGEFPNLKKHLDKFKRHITSSNKPYGIHRDRSSKINPFEQPKLICKSMFKIPEFTYDNQAFYVGFSFSVICQQDKDYDLKYLLGLLNSGFGKYWFTKNGKKRGVGVDIGVKKFREFPVPRATNKMQTPIIKLVDKILKQKDKAPESDTSKLEKQIDKAVYKLYGLTKYETKVIENEAT